MTPESLIGAFDLLDRWRLMLLQMQGQMPELPALPGRVHCLPRIPESDPYADAWDAAHAPADDGEGNTPD